MGFISPIATDGNGNPIQTGAQQVLGKDEFLQLLIAKLENQDPMSPMEDEDFVAQLAQFSSLEQLNNIADNLASSNEWDYLQMQSINNVMASSFIGKDIRAEFNGVYADGTNDPKISYTIDSPAERVNFTIKNAAGAIVAHLTENSIDPGVNSVSWDGTDSSGNRVDEGYYYVEATAVSIAGNELSVSLSLEGTVEAVVYREGSAYLRVNGTEIALSDVSTIAEAGSYNGDGDDNDES